MTDIHRLARIAARAAKRRYHWADLDDMVQEAALAMLRASPKYRPERGSLESFLMYAAWFRLGVWIWENGVVRQRPDRNQGWAMREPLDAAPFVVPDPEELMRRAQLSRAVQSVLKRCSISTQLALTGEGSVTTIARDMGQDSSQARRELRVAKAALREVAREHAEETLA
jgi:DNA-directed RNA polymerase specialized sigma24 family protein